MKFAWPFRETVPVRVVNESVPVAVAQKPFLVNLFDGKEVPANASTMGPLGGLDLTGYAEYRLVLHLAGVEDTPFSIREIFGPAGGLDQVSFEVGKGRLGAGGTLNYRGRFDIYGPRNFFVQITNEGEEPLLVNGTLYAVR